MKTRYAIAAALAIAVIGGGAWYISLPSAGQNPNGQVVETASLTRGSTLYAGNCAACHGTNLEGAANWRSADADGIRPAPPHDDSGHTWHHTDELLFAYVWLGGEETQRRMGISNPNSAMPGFRDSLTQMDVMHILSFIKSRWSARNRAYQQKITRQSQG